MLFYFIYADPPVMTKKGEGGGDNAEKESTEKKNPLFWLFFSDCFHDNSVAYPCDHL